MPQGMSRPRLGDRARAAIRLRHLSPRTEEAYVQWMRRYYEFHGRRDPAGLSGEHVTAFLNALVSRHNVSASTQNQALAAISFLYREVLGRELPWLDDLVRAKSPERLPVVLTRAEIRAVLTHMDGVPRLMAVLLYGSGLRLLECCRLRVKDVDFSRQQILVRRGKGDKDRMTMLPSGLKGPLFAHLERVSDRHQRDLEQGAGWVELPGGLSRKLPTAGRDWVWQWVFPATRMYLDRDTGQRRRHHFHETAVQQAVRRAVLASRIPKRATCHTFRHPPPGGRQRYPHRPGAARPQRRCHHHDLHARVEPRPSRREESRRPDARDRRTRAGPAARPGRRPLHILGQTQNCLIQLARPPAGPKPERVS